MVIFHSYVKLPEGNILEINDEIYPIHQSQGESTSAGSPGISSNEAPRRLECDPRCIKTGRCDPRLERMISQLDLTLVWVYDEGLKKSLVDPEFLKESDGF